jgi:hypothetical protein
MRFRAKSFNFGLLFGATAFTVAIQNIEPFWSLEDCRTYIDENELWENYQNHLDKLLNSGKYSGRFSLEENEEKCLYWTVANDVRTKFFKTYPGLEKWINTTTEKAKKTGYTRSVYGAIRRLPYLTFTPTRENDVDIRKYNNNLNIALNSPIQHMESIIINRWMLEINREIKDKAMKSCMNGQIHDAKESLVHEKEIADYIKLVHRIGEKDYPEYDGIPLEVESNLSNYWQDNELWDMGNEIKIENDKVYRIIDDELFEVA